MQQPPPGWPAPPHFHPHAPYPQPSFQPPPRASWISRYWFVFALAGIPLLVGMMALHYRQQEAANYVVFDSPDVEVTVKVDGRELKREDRSTRLGPKVPGGSGGRGPLVAEVKAGKHTIEIVDGAEKVIESTVIDVPPSGYRAVYTVGEPRRYVFVSVAYGTATIDGPDEVTLNPGPSPHLSLLPSNPTTYRRDFESIDRDFPASVYTKGGTVMRGLCSLSEDDLPECNFKEERKRR
jgi:hypothetical protein